MEAEPPQRWAATYTKHVKQKRKAYHDGALLLYPASGRLVLLDDADHTLESRFLGSSEEVSPGAALSFNAHLVDVGDPEDGPASYTSSSASAAAGTRTARRGGGVARARPPSSGRVFPPRVSRSFTNPSKGQGFGGGGEGDGEAAGSGGAVSDSRFQEWTAMYTAQLTQKAKKYHDGFVRLVQAGPHVKQIVLLDEDGQVLGSRHLKPGESIESGKKCHFPNYLIDICEAKNQNKAGEHTSEESMVHTRQKNVGNTCNKMGLGALSKSQKFVSPQKFHDLVDTRSEVTASSGKPEIDKVEAVAASHPGSLMEPDSGFKEWNALYTTQLTQKAKKYHDGIIRLVQIGSHARQIVLLDEYGEVLGNRYLKSVESVESGTKCQLPNYLIEVCEPRNQINEPKHSSKDALNQTGLTNEKNTSDKEKSKSPKFVSPFKSQDARKSNWGSAASSNRPQIGKTTCSNLDAPQNFHVLSDLQRRKSDCNFNREADYSQSAFDIQRGSATNSLPEFGKSTSSRVGGDPLQFDGNLQYGKSGCSNSFIRREVGKSTFGNMDDSLRTASQILSIMKPPSNVRISQSSQSGQPHSLASSEARIAFDASCRKNTVVDDSNKIFDGSGTGTSGMSHFATQLRTSVLSCLNLETPSRKNSLKNESSGNSHPTYDHQTAMRPAAFEGQDLAMFDIPASAMSSANQKRDSSSLYTGSSSGTESCFNISTDPVLQEDKSGSAIQLSTQNSISDGKCDGSTTSTSAYTLTCKDPKIQELIDDCPSFDLGF
ncbi:unnamed protein product [Urochloa decumbens]|uniref:5'-3' DNA helicase ZGRF1-like N-terminal domain-containing protein n=1 Tax=Urochloa decumbens TaxID=240449 RepID=A0ABC9G8J8_9POAL